MAAEMIPETVRLERMTDDIHLGIRCLSGAFDRIGRERNYTLDENTADVLKEFETNLQRFLDEARYEGVEYEDMPECETCGTRHYGRPRGEQCALPDGFAEEDGRMAKNAPEAVSPDEALYAQIHDDLHDALRTTDYFELHKQPGAAEKLPGIASLASLLAGALNELCNSEHLRETAAREKAETEASEAAESDDLPGGDDKWSELAKRADRLGYRISLGQFGGFDIEPKADPEGGLGVIGADFATIENFLAERAADPVVQTIDGEGLTEAQVKARAAENQAKRPNVGEAIDALDDIHSLVQCVFCAAEYQPSDCSKDIAVVSNVILEKLRGVVQALGGDWR